jgi:hypothetical protein
MTKATTPPAAPVPVAVLERGSIPAYRPVAEAPAFSSASHEALFESMASSRCDACGEPLDEESAEEGYGVRGAGVYMWKRGDDVHFEPAPLCSFCAAAIGMTALARWEIEEEEG